MKQICIIGTGGFAKEILCIFKDLNQIENVYCFLEQDTLWEKSWKDKKIKNIPVLPMSSFDPSLHSVVIGIGNSVIREKIVEELPKETNYPNIIHPSVIKSEWIELGCGNVICAGSILTCDIKIGNHCQINLDSTIGHDNVIGNYFTTAPSVNISGSCNIGNHVYFGTSSVVRQGIKITNNVIVGMGAIITKNIDAPGTYVGMPAKIMKRK